MSTVTLIGRFVRHLERRLEAREGTRIRVPFALNGEAAFGCEAAGVNHMLAMAEGATADSETFFALDRLPRFEASARRLTFISPVRTADRANTVVGCDLYPPRTGITPASPPIVLVSHWNADPRSYGRLARLLGGGRRMVVVVTLPYHGARAVISGSAWPLACADIGLTIQSLRQAVLDVRAVIAWLVGQGASEVHLVGASLGSCVAALVSAHDPAVTRCVALHAAPDLADVVWSGSILGHVREEIAPHMSLEQLRQAWAPVSPGSYAHRLARPGFRMLVVSGAHDTVLLPGETERLVSMLRDAGAEVRHHVLECGHQTLAWLPFGAMAVLRAIRFLK